MKKKIILLLALFTIYFTAYSETSAYDNSEDVVMNFSDISTMIEAFLNKGSYIKTYYLDEADTSIRYYPKSYITYIYPHVYKSEIRIYFESIGTVKYHIDADIINFNSSKKDKIFLDDNNNLIIIREL